MIMTANANTINVGLVLIVLGLISLVFAAFMLYCRRDIKRLFAYSSIEHMGIITFAFGMGGPLANFAGLLHMTMHSLTKSAIIFAVGHIAQVKGRSVSPTSRVCPSATRCWRSARARRRRDRRPATVRCIHLRVHAGVVELRAPAVACGRAGVRIDHRVRRADPAAAGRAVRRAERAVRRDQGDLCAAVSASRARADGRLWLPEPLVRWIRAVAAQLG